MTSGLTETIKTQIKLVISDGHCTLCRNKLEERIYVNQLVNETEASILPKACKNTEVSYINVQGVDEDTNVAPITQNDNDLKRYSNVSNPTYNRSIEDDIIMSTMTSSDNSIIDNNHNRVRKDSTKRPIPVPRTSISGSNKKASNSLGFNVSELESSMIYPQKAWSEDLESKFVENSTSEEIQAKQNCIKETKL